MAGACRRGPRTPPTDFAELTPGVGYTNERVSREPWSIHIVRIDQGLPDLAIHSTHAQGGTPGLSSLSEQVRRSPAAFGTPVAAVNGDFYQRDREHAGDPRGLQIKEGELISAPNGGVAFWVDTGRQLHATNVNANFHVTWPDGTTNSFGLNQDRKANALVLYTPALGASTRTSGGREFILEPAGEAASRPLAINETLAARVLEVRDSGDSPIQTNRFVLSAGPALIKTLPHLSVGDSLQFTTATTPELRGALTAIGGGPVLVRGGQVQRIQPPSEKSYEFSSMMERHPRSAIGWDSRYFYLVTVDGRQEKLSVGMTLAELAQTFAQLGCTDAMNLDGGGSATLWCDGKIRNNPCDGQERPIANALVVTRKAGADSSARKEDRQSGATTN